MRYLPIELDVRGRAALVVGSGHEVPSKVDRLIDAGATITIVAERPSEELEEREKHGKVSIERRAFVESDLDGKVIVFIAPDEETVAARAYALAIERDLLVGTIDRPEHSTFINSALVRASGLTMTFSSGGASPGALRRIREDLTALFDDSKLERFLVRLRALRESLPRGERARRVSEAVKEFRIEAKLVFPDWFSRDDPADESS